MSELHDKIKQLPKGEKAKIGLPIRENTDWLFSKFAKEQRLKKFDLYEVAILDMIEKYSDNK